MTPEEMIAVLTKGLTEMERENRELRAEVNRLGKQNDEMCDEIFDLQNKLRDAKGKAA